MTRTFAPKKNRRGGSAAPFRARSRHKKWAPRKKLSAGAARPSRAPALGWCAPGLATSERPQKEGSTFRFQGRKRKTIWKRKMSGHLRAGREGFRSEEHTSELQSHLNLVCRLLLEKKKKKKKKRIKNREYLKTQTVK